MKARRSRVGPRGPEWREACLTPTRAAAASPSSLTYSTSAGLANRGRGLAIDRRTAPGPADARWLTPGRMSRPEIGIAAPRRITARRPTGSNSNSSPRPGHRRRFQKEKRASTVSAQAAFGAHSQHSWQPGSSYQGLGAPCGSSRGPAPIGPERRRSTAPAHGLSSLSSALDGQQMPDWAGQTIPLGRRMRRDFRSP